MLEKTFIVLAQGHQLRGFAKYNKFQKFELTMEVGGWVQVSLKKIMENRSKIALYQF